LENIKIKEPSVLIISKTQKYYFHQRIGKKNYGFLVGSIRIFGKREWQLYTRSRFSSFLRIIVMKLKNRPDNQRRFGATSYPYNTRLYIVLQESQNVPNEKRKPKRALLASAVTTGIIPPLTQVWISTMAIPSWWKEANVMNSWNLETTIFPRKVFAPDKVVMPVSIFPQKKCSSSTPHRREGSV